MKPNMTYGGSGVNYDDMDPFKKEAQKAGLLTAGNIIRFGFSEVEASRGESAYLVNTPFGYLAHVIEGLGTKNKVAEAMYALAIAKEIEKHIGMSYLGNVAICTVAMIVNDIITVGALPISVAMHLAVGASDWFKDEGRYQDLINGWKIGCDIARCTWGGGETPTLIGIVYPDTILLSGSAMGIITPKERLILPWIVPGTAIMLIGSSGIHANGLTLARDIADILPDGYLTLLPDGRTYGESLLDPTDIYVQLIENCQLADIEILYTANITGHGWRKLMRSPQKNLQYIIERVPEPQPIFKFIQEKGNVTDKEMYGNYNMGAGFALFVSEKDVEQVTAIANGLGMAALRAGHVEESKTKRLIIDPVGLEYSEEELAVR